jgi:hypothetical protein
MLTNYQITEHEDADLLTPVQIKQFIETMLANARLAPPLGGTRDRLQSRNRLRRHPNLGQ